MDIRGSANIKQHLNVAKNFNRGVSNKGSVSGGLALNLYESSVFSFELTGNLTLTLNNPTLGSQYTLIIKQDSTNL